MAPSGMNGPGTVFWDSCVVHLSPGMLGMHRTMSTTRVCTPAELVAHVTSDTRAATWVSNDPCRTACTRTTRYSTSTRVITRRLIRVPGRNRDTPSTGRTHVFTANTPPGVRWAPTSTTPAVALF